MRRSPSDQTDDPDRSNSNHGRDTPLEHWLPPEISGLEAPGYAGLRRKQYRKVK